jgi:hydrogenase maturation protein HypF
MSSLTGVCHRVAYEAEAAMRFEALARDSLDDCGVPYRFDLVGDPAASDAMRLDAGPVITAAAADVLAGLPPSVVAARFHLAVATLVVDVATRLRSETGLDVVALSGGVFLNVVLTSLCTKQLQDNDFRVLSHHLVPPSDAGLSLGQLVVAGRVQ